MLIARWNIDVRFGQKNNFTSAYKKWSEEVGNKVGLSQDKLRVTTGSIGVNESRFECEYTVESGTITENVGRHVNNGGSSTIWQRFRTNNCFWF